VIPVIVHPEIEKLLALQQVDAKWLAAQAQIESSPREVERLKKRIGEVEAQIAQERADVKALEVRAADLNSERKSLEEKARKYRTQQMEVKKNEEYQALEKEIANLVTQASALEDDELTLLMQLDDEREAFAEKEKTHRKEIESLEGEIKLVERRIETLKGEAGGLQTAVEERRKEVSDTYIRAYENARQRQKKAPWVVPVEDHRCMGCHLKISGSLETDSRKGAEPAFCNNCGRLIFVA